MPTLLPQIIIGIGYMGCRIIDDLEGDLQDTDYEKSGFYSFIKTDSNAHLTEENLRGEISRLFAAQLPDELRQTFSVPTNRSLNVFLVGSLQEEIVRSSLINLIRQISDIFKPHRMGQYRICPIFFTGFSSQDSDEHKCVLDALANFNKEAAKLGNRASELVSRVLLLSPVAPTGREITSSDNVQDILFLLLSTFLCSPLSTEQKYRDLISFTASRHIPVDGAETFPIYGSFGVAAVEFPAQSIATFLSRRLNLRLLEQMLESNTRDEDEVARKAEEILKRDIHSFISRDSTGSTFDSQIRFGYPGLGTPQVSILDSAEDLKLKVSPQIVKGWINSLILWTGQIARNIPSILRRLKGRRLLIQDQMINSIEKETQDILLSSTRGLPLAQRYLSVLKKGLIQQKDEIMLRLKSSSSITSVVQFATHLEGNLGPFEKASSKKPSFSAISLYLGLFWVLGAVLSYDILRRDFLSFPRNLISALAGSTLIALVFLFFLILVPHLSVRKAFRQLIRARDSVIQGVRNGLIDRFTIHGVLGQQVRTINRILDSVEATQEALIKIKEQIEKEREKLGGEETEDIILEDTPFRKFVYPEGILKSLEAQISQSVFSESNLSSIRSDIFALWREGKISPGHLSDSIRVMILGHLRGEDCLYQQKDLVMVRLKTLMRELSPFLAESYEEISGEGAHDMSIVIAGEDLQDKINELLSQTEYRDFQFLPSENRLRVSILKTRLNIPFRAIRC
jgi:hypothetical protein